MTVCQTGGHKMWTSLIFFYIHFRRASMRKRKIMMPLILLIFLIGCNTHSQTALDLYHALDDNLSQQDQQLLNNLLGHAQKFHQLNQELTMLVEEMKKNDELEAAIETMQIANEEAMYIYNLIELDEKPSNHSLKELRKHIQASIEKYMEAMNTQLKGITTGEPQKSDEGYKEMNQIKEEFNHLISSLNSEHKTSNIK